VSNGKCRRRLEDIPATRFIVDNGPVPNALMANEYNNTPQYKRKLCQGWGTYVSSHKAIKPRICPAARYPAEAVAQIEAPMVIHPVNQLAVLRVLRGASPATQWYWAPAVG
jgi:hypothetical protein